MYVCPQRLHVRTYLTVMQTTFGRCPGMLFTPSFPIPGGGALLWVFVLEVVLCICLMITRWDL